MKDMISNTPNLSILKADLKRMGSSKRAQESMWFFQATKDGYGAHERFIGVKVPDQRAIARKYRHLPLADTEKLLQSKIHEHRLTALFILDLQFKAALKGMDGGSRRRTKAVKDRAKANMVKRVRKETYSTANAVTLKHIVQLYLRNLGHVNNWDLVDSSAPNILGAYLASQPTPQRKKLYTLAYSPNLWKKRIAMITTLAFIRENDFTDALNIATILLRDKHDLIHKAVGWMLREVGNRDRSAEEAFLKKHYHNMPRTMLRYAIEKFPEPRRQAYLRGRV